MIRWRRVSHLVVGLFDELVIWEIHLESLNDSRASNIAELLYRATRFDNTSRVESRDSSTEEFYFSFVECFEM